MADFTQEKIYKLINYASSNWGRLCIPQDDDINQSRWPIAPIWAEVQRLIQEWHNNYEEVAKREYDYRNDISQAYLNSFAGWIAGSMVRVGLENEEEMPVDITGVLLYLQDKGLTLPELSKRAANKWKVASKLNGVEPS